jgi:hypothetical protein
MTKGFDGQQVHGTVIVGLAKALHDYERVVYVSGPASGVALVLSVLGVAAAFRRREGAVCAALAGTAVLLLVIPVVAVALDYRYVLLSRELLVAAGVLGGSLAIARWRHTRPVRRLSRPAVTWAAVAVAGAVLVTTNATAYAAYAGRSYTPRTVGVVNTPGYLGNRLMLQVPTPLATGMRCQANAPGVPRRVRWLVDFDLQARWLRGYPLLVAGENLYVRQDDGQIVRPNVVVPGARRPLIPAMVARGAPAHGGWLGFSLSSQSGTLIYIDPLGAGVTGWRFTARPDPRPLPPAGSVCA